MILAAGVLLAGECRLSAQEYESTPVTISKEKVRMDGKLYYSHIVMERQTLFSISKAYGVSMEDIYRANAGLRETGLKKNAIILIPAFEQQEEAPAQEKPAAEERKTDEKKKEKDRKDEYTVHTVKWYEDLDAISEKYGVPVEVIMEYNGLSGRKLSKRQKLRIPTSVDMPVRKEQEVQAAETPVDIVRQESAASENHKDGMFKLFPKNKVSVMLMLPFSGSEGNLDFYCGALLAARDMGKEGTNIDLSVYDISDGNLHVTEERLRSSDIVIGPILPSNLERLAAVTPKTTGIVSPLDHKAEYLAERNRNFIQAPTPYRTQYKDIINWMKEDKAPEDRVILIKEKGARDTEEMLELTNTLANSGMQYSTFSYSIIEGRNILQSLSSLMNPDAVNRVLIASESGAFLNDAVRNLNLMLHNKYRVVLYAPSKIRSVGTIDVENLHDVNLHVSLAYYVDYDNPKVRKFIMEYRALYNTEPTPFAFQGYDIARYFIHMCSKYGNNWMKVAEIQREELLQSDFEFERKSSVDNGLAENIEGGLVNKAVKRIVYGENYTIEEIR